MSLGKRLFDVVRANSLQARTGREKNFADVEPVYTDAWLAAEVQDPDPTPDEVFTAQELQWFRDLRLGPGADADAIRRAYRQQIRTFHPDRFAADPEKFEVATEVARGLTAAYNGLMRSRPR